MYKLRNVKDCLICGDEAVCGYNHCLRCFIKHYKDKGYKEGYKKGVEESRLSKPVIKTLITLCHPDKHNNSKDATEITKWLLKKR